MSDHSRFKSTTGLNDLLFNLLVGFVFLFVIAFLLINPPTKKSDAPKKAEYLIVLEWDIESGDDIDLWVKDPLGTTVSFTNKTGGLLNLEKDDLGMTNDKWTQPDGTVVVVPINREVITMRGIVPGRYQIAAHVYSTKRWYKRNGNGEIINKAPGAIGNVTATLIRINPYGEVFKTATTYVNKGQILSLFNFTLARDGSVSLIDERKSNIVTRRKARTSQ